jgi:hypothetical protein
MLPSFYHNILEKYLNPQQLFTLQMLVWLLQSQKQVRIERLAATLPLTIYKTVAAVTYNVFYPLKRSAYL